MNKIIVAIDGLKFSNSSVRYAIELARETNSHLLGVFLEDFTYHSYKIYELVGNEGVAEDKRDYLDEKDTQTREASLTTFGKLCSQGGINYSVHRDKNIAIRELLHESVFADLVIIDRSETLTHHPENVPTRFIRDFLEHATGPVMVVPEKYKQIDKIILLYDADPASVHAIKMFNYILPTALSKPVEVLSVKNPDSSLHLPNNRLMKEFMKRHYPDAEYTVLKGNAEEEIVRYIRDLKQNVLVVLGAYKRGLVSRWFRPSMADALMKELNFPLFIAHH